MRIRKEPFGNFLYVFEFPFSRSILEYCRNMRLRYGRSFMFSSGAWRFNVPKAAFEIKADYPQTVIDASMHDDLLRFQEESRGAVERQERASELKEAKDCDIEVPGLKGELYPFQRVGVAFMVNAGGKALLADPMGSGKTVQSLAYVLKARPRKTLVICPASAKMVWKAEAEKWTSLKPYTVVGKSAVPKGDLSSHDVVVVNYDLLRYHFDALMSCVFDCVIMDEVHYIKNVSAKRTKMAMALGRRASHLILLSGTPVLSRPVEIFNALNLLDPNEWPDWKSFAVRYCDGKVTSFGWDARGATNVPELARRLSPYMLRRPKEAILPDLPPKRHILMPVELDSAARKEYSEVEDTFRQYLSDQMEGIVEGTPQEVQAMKLTLLGKLRQVASSGKAYAMRDLVDGVVSQGEKIIVFSVFNAPLDDMHAHYGDSSVLVHGKVSESDRTEAVERFQNDPSVCVFLGGLKAAGVALTLTAASSVAFLDYSWVPADHWQGEDRIHRPGQKAESLSIYQLHSGGTVDDHVLELLERKKLLVSALVDGSVPSGGSSSLEREVLGRYERDFGAKT